MKSGWLIECQDVYHPKKPKLKHAGSSRATMTTTEVYTPLFCDIGSPRVTRGFRLFSMTHSGSKTVSDKKE